MESACAEIIRLAEKVMDGGEITQEEAKSLIRTKDEDTMLLLAMALLPVVIPMVRVRVRKFCSLRS